MTRPTARSGSTARVAASPARNGVAGRNGAAGRHGAAPATSTTAKGRRKRPPAAESVTAKSAPPPADAPKPVQRPAMPSGYIPPPFSLTPTPLFKVGDKAVHPSHGVGEVTSIDEREIAGT